MTPRWTVDDEDRVLGALRFESVDGRTSYVHARHHAHSSGAWDALVAAVRDADTLRQARETARLVRALQRDDCRREAILMADSLLDLLAPPVPDTEGTTT